MRSPPQQLKLAVKAAEELADRYTRSHRAAELARGEADCAERAFSNVDPDNRPVARTLEGKWEAKLVALADAEADLVTAKADRHHVAVIMAVLPQQARRSEATT